MEEVLWVRIDREARNEIVSESGSMSRFFDIFKANIEQDAEHKASVFESPDEMENNANVRGGDLLEIVTATSGLIAAITPMVIAWFRSRGFEADIKVETRKNGTVIQSVHVRKGTKM